MMYSNISTAYSTVSYTVQCFSYCSLHCLLQSVCSKLLAEYHWDIQPGQQLAHKWLPVSRPKEGLHVLFKRRKPDLPAMLARQGSGRSEDEEEEIFTQPPTQIEGLDKE